MMLRECYNAIIQRGALMPGGILFNPDRVVPDDLAYVLSNGSLGQSKVVTWADVMAERRERQRWRLDQLRHVNHWRAYKVWVAYFDQFLMGGWQAFIENRDERNWIDRDRQRLMAELMELFPLVLPLDGKHDQWQAWKVAFATQFKRRTQDRRPVGVVYVWWNGWDKPRRHHNTRS